MSTAPRRDAARPWLTVRRLVPPLRADALKQAFDERRAFMSHRTFTRR